jgi:hypothetical protein
MTYRIDLTKFGDEPSLVEQNKPREAGNAKFNIKVRKADLDLIDRIAELSGRSRAYLLNDIVQNILVDMLHEMQDDDEGFAALLAHQVDKRCGKDWLAVDGWSAALFGLQPKNLYNPDESRQSEKHKELLRRIEGINK